MKKIAHVYIHCKWATLTYMVGRTVV